MECAASFAEAVNCKELMKSFGWDTTDAFTQHDAQDSARVECCA